MREDTGMRPAREEVSPLMSATGWRHVVRALRVVLRPRATALSRGASRVAAGAILAAGVIAQALFGWRWWLVVIVLTVAGEAAMLGPTLARSAERDELIDELVAVLSPSRQARRRSRRALQRFEAAPFPLYGLPPSWTGARFLGGWAAQRDYRAGVECTTSMQLGHGERLADRGPLLLVEVDANAWPRLDPPNLAERLAHAGAGVGSATPTGPRPTGAGTAARAGPAGASPAAVGAEAGSAVERVEIPVDGEPVSFELLADRRHWVAQGERGDLVVTLEARDFPLAQVQLVRVTDLEPYLAGPDI
jgi:hypothetical protein